MLAELCDVAQLLGRLCALPSLLTAPTCYTLLLSCVLVFCREWSSTPLDRKAKQWALVRVLGLGLVLLLGLVSYTPGPHSSWRDVTLEWLLNLMVHNIHSTETNLIGQP